MKILYLDCFAGISGDMLLGALLDLGITVQTLTDRLAGLKLNGYHLTADKTAKIGITATKASVNLTGETHNHRHLPDILDIIARSDLPAGVKEKSITAFTSLAAAEGKIHGIPPEQVHFHEVGAIDAIVDIVGTFTAFDILGVDRVYCSQLPLGSGFVQCAHGTLPLPAPATLELLRGIPTVSCDTIGETVTPTGAALVKTLASKFGPMPSMEIHSVGYGAGQADRNIPNVLRAVLGESAEADAINRGTPEGEALHEDSLLVIEANIDDMNPEFYEYIISLLLTSGAVDAYITPVIMKKGRPGQILSCLVPQEAQTRIVNILLTETTSLGVRTYTCNRHKLEREIRQVQTDFGVISIKVGRHPGSGAIMNIAPEWEECKEKAIKHKTPVKTIYDLAKAEAIIALTYKK